MKDLIYTESFPFRVERKQRKKQEYKDFFFLKLITNFYGKNGNFWQQTGFLSLQIIGVILSLLVLDLPLLFGKYVLINIAKSLFILIIRSIELALELIFKTILGEVIFKKFIAPILRWTAIVSVLFLVFYIYYSGQWKEIYNILDAFWSSLPWPQ